MIRFKECTKRIASKASHRLSTYDVQVYNNKSSELRSISSAPKLEEITTAAGKKKSDFADHTAFLSDRETVLELKKRNIELYKRLVTFQLPVSLVEKFPSVIELPGKRIAVPEHCKSMYVDGTIRLQIDKKLYALSRHFTWMYSTGSDDPVERMKGKSVVLVLHQDPFLIEPTLAWSKGKQPYEELVDSLAIFRYIFALSVPFARGSSAIGEWLEETVFKYHGYEGYTRSTEKLVDLEAMAALDYKSFREVYESCFTLS